MSDFWIFSKSENPIHTTLLIVVIVDFLQVQKDFVNALQREEDPDHRFRVDRWTRAEGGGGVTCILQV